MRLWSVSSQVLGLHLPVMKLCLASVSCVIENRLESEDNELERRLLRRRRPSSSTSGRHGGGEAAPPGVRPSSSSTPAQALPAGSATVPTAGLSSSRPRETTTATRAVGQDLPLSHTWHGVRAAATASTRDDPERGDDAGQAGGGGGGVAGRFGVNTGSRTNLLKTSRRWGGTGSGSRVHLDGDALHAVGEDAPAGSVTPTKSVKFVLGRKRTETSGLSTTAAAAAAAAAAASGAGGGATAAGRSASHAGVNGASKAVEGEAADPRAAVMNVTVQTRLWAEYFNNTLRCWEALLDPFRHVFYHALDFWFAVLRVRCFSTKCSNILGVCS